MSPWTQLQTLMFDCLWSGKKINVNATFTVNVISNSVKYRQHLYAKLCHNKIQQIGRLCRGM